MAGNVAEWTSSLYYEGGYSFQHDMNPDIRWNAKDSDPPRMKRKVLRGGSGAMVFSFKQVHVVTNTRTQLNLYRFQVCDRFTPRIQKKVINSKILI